jgi:hypothetical protein
MVAVMMCFWLFVGCLGASEITGTTDVAGGTETPFPEAMFGVWEPKKGEPVHSILGPLSSSMITFHAGAFSALRDRKTGDVWFTMLVGQAFHVSGNEMQYCFGEEVVFEQSPFSVHSVSDTNVTFCWRTGGRGMPTHTRGCTGCDCASIQMTLTDANTLHFQFWQSRPVLHTDMKLVRSKPEPSFAWAVKALMPSPYTQCRIKDRRSTNVHGEIDSQTNSTTLPMPAGCPLSASLFAKRDPTVARLVDDAMALDDSKSANKCRQLNGLNHLLDKIPIYPTMNVPDVRLQYKIPTTDCNPCDVSYSLSAKINEDEYISVGFKGQSWEGSADMKGFFLPYDYPPEKARPCYFGMCVDPFDNYTSDRIALGYASSSGSCVREMVSKNVVGTPTDVDYKILKQTSVERARGRTILRFTVSQTPFKHRTFDSFRVMWAIGKVSGGSGCAADVGFHGSSRGVAPISWLGAINSLPCAFSSYEMDGMESTDIMFT